jgi:hypothetical protein
MGLYKKAGKGIKLQRIQRTDQHIKTKKKWSESYVNRVALRCLLRESFDDDPSMMVRWYFEISRFAEERIGSLMSNSIFYQQSTVIL